MNKYQFLEKLRDDEYAALKADIQKRGVLIPVELDSDGTILDGHNRVEIATSLHIPYPTITREFKTEDEKKDHVVKINLARRHLDPLRWGLTFRKLLEFRGISRGQGKRNELTSATIAEVANEMGTPKRTAEHRLSLADQFSKLPDKDQQEVVSGTKPLKKALRELQRKKGYVEPKFPTGKYRVIYADPPWEYGNSGLTNYGHAEQHYQTLSIEKLCALPVIEITEDNAVLFLWITSPLLAECWPVIKSWGFKYKASFVWDKEIPAFGNYNSVQHELLLVCTKGSCLPDKAQKVSSVLSIKKTRKHSEKPEHFRKMIDDLYPKGKRIELFSRKKTEGWDAYGDHIPKRSLQTAT